MLATIPSSSPLHVTLDLDDPMLYAPCDDEAFFTPRGSFFEQAPPSLPLMRFSSATSYSEDESTCHTNLDHFHGEARIAALLSEGEFSRVRVLQECCNGAGSVELHKWSSAENSEDDIVVIKQVPLSRLRANKGKETDECKVHRFGHERYIEDCLTEIGVYSYLSRQQDKCPYVLKMYKAFEVGGDVNIVLQHANGGDLFDILKDTTNIPVTSEQVVRWMWQLLQAVDFLHRHHVGHRDISVENILLHSGAAQLMDFGHAVQTHNANGVPLRYFRASGKDYCRAPEQNVPREAVMTVTAPRFSHGGEIAFVQTLDHLCEVRLPFNSSPLQECMAEPCGYQVPPVDMFACGVCLFVMAARMPPWREARPADPHFSFVHAKGVSQLLKAWRKKVQPEMEDLLAILLQADPSERLDVSESLTHPLFDQMAKPNGS